MHTQLITMKDKWKKLIENHKANECSAAGLGSLVGIQLPYVRRVLRLNLSDMNILINSVLVTVHLNGSSVNNNSIRALMQHEC